VAWVEADRVIIRDMCGFSALFLQADPRTENAITSVQASSVPGGTRPDNSSELAIRSYMLDYANVCTNLTSLWNKALATQVDTIKIDCLRAMALLRSEGRRTVGRVARTLGVTPRFDVFSTPAYNPTDSNPFTIRDEDFPGGSFG
jgi:hypothetical protein